MSDEKERSAPAAPGLVISAANVPWTRSSAFRLVWAALVKPRLGAGECTLTFSSIADTAGPTGQAVVQEEVAVTLSWTQLKSMSVQLNDIVFAIETEMGELPTPPFTYPSKIYRQMLIDQLKAIFGRKKDAKA